jgi:gliding motility-associated-like protein
MKYRIFSCLFFIITSTFSQTRTDNWFFGKNAGIHFNPINKNVSKISSGNIFAPASSSVTSNKDGQLLFYTNGGVVTDNSHSFIDTNKAIGGEFNNASTVIIVPKPNHPNLYYVITTRIKPSPNIFDPISPGLYYSEVNSATKNFTIKRTQILDFPVTKLSAVHHSNGKDIWLVTIGMHIFNNSSTPSRAFFSIKITENGFDTPVITKINGTSLPLNGALKISPDGTKIAYASLEDGIFVHNFNAFDGSISSSLNIPKINPIKNYEVFGIEFSQNTKFIYTSSKLEGGDAFIHQYDLTPNNRQLRFVPIFSSSNNENYGALQLANNGKIYHSINFGNGIDDYGNSLGVINEPNKEGMDANYIHNSIVFNSEKTFKSLPSFIQSNFNSKINTIQGCVNSPTKFSASTYTQIDKVTWDFGDGNTSNILEPNHIYNTTGVFNVTAIIDYDGQRLKIEKEIEIFPLPTVINNTKLVQCEINNLTQTSFDLSDINEKVTNNASGSTFTYFESRNEAISGSNNIIKFDEYKINGNQQELFVRVYDENGCYSIANFFIETTAPSIEIISDMYSCSNTDNFGMFDLETKKSAIKTQLNLTSSSSLKLFASALDAQLKRNEIEGNYSTKTTTIWARVDSNTGCGSISPINLIVNNLPSTNKVNDQYNICYITENQAPLILDGDALNDRFEWKINNKVLSRNQFFTIEFPGKYTLTVYKTNNGIECSNTKEFKVSYFNPPKIENITVDTESSSNKISISVTGQSTYNYSLDNLTFFGNSSTYTFENVNPGIHTIYIKDQNDCEPPIKKEVTVLGFPASFTPNDDGVNERWNIAGGSKLFFKHVNVHIYNRFGNLLYIINNRNREYGWDGNSEGNRMPSNDYWFTAILEDYNGNIIKKTGHFSLIRKP